MAASSSTIQVTSTPFAAFPHIVALSDGSIIEVFCPSCTSNVVNRAPFPFFEGVGGMTLHMARVHKDAKLSPSQYLASPNLRVLSQEEIDAIKAGKWQGVITKRVVAKAGGTAKEIKINKSIPIPFYPIIVKLKDDKYSQLACKFCDGNAQIRHGSNGAKVDKVEFFQGANGLRLHIDQAHKEQLKIAGVETLTNQWVIRNCGIVLREKYVEALKKDLALRFISMIKATSDKVMSDKSETADDAKAETGKDAEAETKEDEESTTEGDEESKMVEDEVSETEDDEEYPPDVPDDAMMALDSDEDRISMERQIS